MRLFLDANILFTAAHKTGGKAALVMEIGQAGIWQRVISAYAVEEVRRNIALKCPDCLERLEAQVQALRRVPDVAEADCAPGLPDKDCPIYRAVRGCQADVLLTGGIRDFGFPMNDR